MAGLDRGRRVSQTPRVIALVVALVMTMVAPIGAAGEARAHSPAPAANADQIDVLIALEPDAPPGLGRALARLGGAITDDLDALDFVNARIPAGQLVALRALPGVTSVSEHVAVEPLLDTTTTQVGAVAGDATQADASFAGTTLTGAGSTIAVIDNGVLADHEFFATGSGASRVLAEGCFANTGCPSTEGDGAAAPRGYHGTHVAGITAGSAPTGAGPVRGVAPGAGLIAVQVFDEDGLADSGTITSAMNWIVEQLQQQDVDPAFAQLSVVNLSLGGNALDSCPIDGIWGGFEQAAAELEALGVLTVAAAGNNGSRTAMSAPACLPSVVGVGSIETDPEIAIASSSNLSTSTALVAPGVRVQSAGSDSPTQYLSLTGTSMAAPHVAGAVALLAQAAPHSTAAERLAALQAADADARVDDQRTGGDVVGLAPLDIRWALGELPGADGASDVPTATSVTVPAGEAVETRGRLQVGWATASAEVTHHAVAYPGGRGCSDTADTGGCLIEGLADETTYTVRVTATGTDGATSAASPRIGPVTTTAGLPGSVRELTGTVGANDVALRWVVPSQGPVTGYEVELSAPDDDGEVAVLPTVPAECTDAGATDGSDTIGATDDTGTGDTAAPGCTITGLTTGSTYLATVRAVNDLGTGPDATFTFRPGLPSEPRDVVAARGDRSVEVSWSAPTGDGGPSVDRYDVATLGPEGPLAQACTTDGAARSCTVDGLDNGVRYRFSVTASNANGSGPSSAASGEVTPAGKPLAPPNVTVTVPATSGAVDVSWDAADGNGAEVSSYRAVAAPADPADPSGQNASCTTNGAQRSCRITGLTDDVTVGVTVTATSEVGVGATSAAIAATPTDPDQTTSDDGDGGGDGGDGGSTGGTGGGDGGSTGGTGGGGAPGGGGGSLPPPDEPADTEQNDGPVLLDDATPAPATGTSELLVGGAPAVASTTSTSRSLVLDAAGVRSELGARADDGTPSPVRAGTVTLPPGGRVDVTTTGLSPETPVVGWLFSEPVRLGSMTVAGDGTSTGSLAVPTSLPAGAHTLQLVATRADGEQFAWSIGVRVEDIASRFPDVGVGVTHWFAIESIAEQGVTLGDGTGNYRPAASLTRGQMARFLTRLLALPAGDPTELTDVDGTQHQAAIESVVAAGIAGGFPDGTFRPNDPVTRGQLATFLAAAADLDAVADGPSTDVAGTTHEGRIHAVVAAGIASGFADGSYRPGVTVTRAQMATLLVGLAEELAAR